MSDEKELDGLRAQLAALEEHAARKQERLARAQALSSELAEATEKSKRPALLRERDELRARVVGLEAAIAVARKGPSGNVGGLGPGCTIMFIVYLTILAGTLIAIALSR